MKNIAESLYELEKVNNCLEALDKSLNELNDIVEYTNKSLEELNNKLENKHGS